MTLKPHDALFKLTFRDPAHAAAELRHLLGAGVGRLIDWGSLRLAPGSGVDAELGENHADLVFEADLVDGQGKAHIVVEHKSSPDPRAPRQLFDYVNQLYQDSEDASNGELPPVICVLVYHGEPPWPFGTSTLQATTIPRGIGLDPSSVLPCVPYSLDDLARESVESLRARDMPTLAKLSLFVLKRARTSPDLLDELRSWIPELREISEEPHPGACHYGLLRYIMQVADVDAADLTEFLATEVGRPAEQLMKSAYQKILEEGEARGEAKGMANLLIRLLETRFGEVPANLLAKVRNASPTDLDLWGERVLSAESLEQVFETA